jgi:2-keto-4-pentenoate hydratase/2-oxohepta-3-ene-1,7-dioic acid hydratase in catechol pathway
VPLPGRVDDLLCRPLPRPQGSAIHLEEVRRAAPVRRPRKLVCVGVNYVDHVLQQGFAE